MNTHCRHLTRAAFRRIQGTNFDGLFADLTNEDRMAAEPVIDMGLGMDMMPVMEGVDGAEGNNGDGPVDPTVLDEL